VQYSVRTDNFVHKIPGKKVKTGVHNETSLKYDIPKEVHNNVLRESKCNAMFFLGKFPAFRDRKGLLPHSKERPTGSCPETN
jgi:hypothetical protein